MKGKFEFLIEICETFAPFIDDDVDGNRGKKKKHNNCSLLSLECLTCGADSVDKTFVIRGN